MTLAVDAVDAGPLRVAYLHDGPRSGPSVVLLHGFPYDAHAFVESAGRIAAEGARVIVPWLRGHGPTAYRFEDSLRSGQQAALGADLLALLDALAIERAIVGGYDWGGRAACVVAALWPERIRGLVTVGGYNLQDIAGSGEPASPESEHRYWYQYYFHGERGRRGLERDRRAFCRLLWRLWSPAWAFDDATYDRSASAFDNPDFVATVIHSYRHRFGLVDGDPAYDALEARLAERPAIGVPTIAMTGGTDGVTPADPSQRDAIRRRFTGPFEHRHVAEAGHNLPQEAPDAFADAVLHLLRTTA